MLTVLDHKLMVDAGLQTGDGFLPAIDVPLLSTVYF